MNYKEIKNIIKKYHIYIYQIVRWKKSTYNNYNNKNKNKNKNKKKKKINKKKKKRIIEKKKK
jgi:hypothetical protein